MENIFRIRVHCFLLQKAKLLFLLFIFSSLWVYGQNSYRVNGIVSDELNEPIIGANIVEVGSTNGTITDAEGRFLLNVKDKNSKLKISYIGYVTKIININNNNNNFHIQLSPNSEQLDEVVVVGYGVMKKSDVVGSLSSVKTNEMVNLPTADVGSMLMGRAPGLQITPNSAEPGGSSTLLIRGKNSISGGNSPLVIVDGVPFSDINDVNPNAIESIEVLKDAASQAIYGARASNGVILITTKSGQEGKMSVSYDNYFAFQNTVRNFEWMDGYENAQLRRESQRFANERNKILDGDFSSGWASEGSVFPFDVQKEALATGNFVDWEDVVFNKNALKQNHSINISGGLKKFKYSTSLRYFNQEGVIKGSGYDQYDFRTNAELQINNFFSVGTNLTYSHTYRDGTSMNGATIANSVLASLYNDDGSYRRYPNGEANFFNPLIDLKEISNKRSQDKFILNVYADIKPFNGFNYRIKGSTNQKKSMQERYNTSQSSKGLSVGGSGYIGNSNNEWLLLENIITYDKKFGDKHKLNATLVNAIEQNTSSSEQMNGEGFPNDILGIHGILTSTKQTLSHSKSQTRLVSYMTRLQYSLMNKYIFNFTMRADGSSVFSEGNKWGYFPTMALGWTISNEKFMENLNEKINIDNLKLRVSYGEVGNQAISPYQTLGVANAYGYVFGDPGNVYTKIGYAPGSRLENPNLHWETTANFNVGLDFSFLNNRINGSFDYYNSQTRDLLLSRSIPSMSGYTKMYDNLGRVENQGLEASLNFDVVRNKDLTVNLGVNVSGNRNKIKALYGDLNGDGKEDDNVGQNQFIGHPIDVYYDYKFDGIWQANQAGENGLINASDGHAIFQNVITYPGDIKIADIKKDGVITPEDRVIISQQPSWMGSFTLNMKYKNFDLLADFYTVQGITKLNPYLYSNDRGGALNGNKNGIRRNYYTPENPSLSVPRPNGTIANIKTIAYQDASYWRLRNLTVGYNIPEKLLKKVLIKNLRIYCSGFNLLTWTDFLSYSPEIDPDQYPETRDFMFGLNVKF